MELLSMILKDIKLVLRDYKALLIMLAMPLILIFILGSALAPSFEVSSTINRFSIAVVDLDGEEIADRFLDVLSEDSIQKLVHTERVKDVDTAMAMLDAQKVAAVVVIPDNLTVAVNGGAGRAGESLTMDIIGDAGQRIQTNIVRTIVDMYAEHYSKVYMGTAKVLELIAKENPGKFQAMDINSFAEKIGVRISEEIKKGLDIFQYNSEEKVWITGFQYYTAGMAIMFILYGAMFGSKSILVEQENYTLKRIFTTQAKKRNIIMGKTISTLLICAIQMFIIIVFSGIVFKVEWGKSIIGVIAVSLCYIFAAVGLFIMIVSFCKTEKIADGIQSISIQILSILGGSMFPIYVFPKSMDAISRLFPTRWALQSYLALMEGKGFIDISLALLVLTIMGVIFLSIGIWKIDIDQ